MSNQNSNVLEKNSKDFKIEPFSFNIWFFIGLYFLMIWLSLFPSVLVGYWYFLTFPFSFDPIYLLMLVPLFFVLYGITLGSALLFTKIGIWIVHKRVAYPKIGTYRITMKDPQTRAFTIKGNIKHLPRWFYYFFHLEFLRVFWLRQMGVKIGKNVKLGMYILDEEFIEIGDNVFMAKNSILPGHLMDNESFTFNRTIIGKNCIFHPISGAVGATVGENSIFLPITGAMKGHICRGNAIYEGVPCKKVGEYSDLSPEDIEEMKRKIKAEDKIDYIKKKNAPIRINTTKLFLMKIAIVLGGCLFGLFIPYLYGLLFQSFYDPSNPFLTFALLALIPIVFLISLGFFVVGTTLFTKIFIAYYDHKGEIPEGTYDLDDPRAKWFKIKYFLRLFGLRLFRGSPFRVADTYAMRFWGNVKLGKDVWMDYGIIDPQYIEIGDYTHIGQGARIHTHDIIDGKLLIKKVKIGKHCLIGTYCHIKPGVQIADGSICAVAAWFRKNKKCKRPALWIGKPAFELPIEMVTKSARVEGRYVD
ncbi:MAG: DapH/DapD/GlmU-related protein [Candidatus Helarchaeota archaeon]